MEKKNIWKRWKGSYASYVMIFFFTYIITGSLASVLSVYLTGIGKSVSQMSLIVSASGIFGLGIVPLVGYLCDRLQNPRLICMILLICMGGLALIYPRCQAVWALFLLQGLIGSFLNATLPVSEQLAASSPYRYGILRVWGTFGFALGAQAAGIAVERFPSVVLFSMIAVSGLLAVAGYLGVVENNEDPMKYAKAKDLSGLSSSSILRSPSFALYLVISFLLSGCASLNSSCVPLMLTGFGIPMGAVGTVLSISTLVEIPMLLFSNRFMDSFSAKSLLVITTVIFLAAMLVLPRLGFGGLVLRMYPALSAGYLVTFAMYALIIFLFYFDDRVGSMMTALVFCAGTAVCSIAATGLERPLAGFGLFGGAMLGWTAGFFRLVYIQKHLDHFAFCRGSVMPVSKKGTQET